jgi:hypothetical protein
MPAARGRRGHAGADHQDQEAPTPPPTLPLWPVPTFSVLILPALAVRFVVLTLVDVLRVAWCYVTHALART